MDAHVSAERGSKRRHLARIVVQGEFGPLLGSAIPECEFAALCGETHISALVRDEAELFGLIERLRDLGATLVSASVERQGSEG